jgi:hypothetical protein
MFQAFVQLIAVRFEGLGCEDLHGAQMYNQQSRQQNNRR